MLYDLISKYISKLEKIQEQVKLNDRIEEVKSFLESRDKFSSFDFSLYKDLFEKANYTNKEIKRIDTNVKYIQLFMSSDESFEYDKFISELKKLFVKLNDLKKDVNNDIELLNKLTDLKNNLDNPSSYIEDIDFIFEIFEHFKISFNDIKDYMKEIIEHNKKISNVHTEELIIDNSSNTEFFDSIVEKIKLSELEYNLLKDYYEINHEEFEDKYNELKKIDELSFIFKNLEKNKELFIVLMILSDINIIREVVNISNSRGIKLNKMLPNIFVNKNKKFNLKNYPIDSDFYELFEGSYEDFINNLKYINVGLDLSKVEPCYYITDGNLVRNNNEIFRRYGINLTIESIECLTIIDLENKLNKIIESGLYDYFRENPRKLLEIKDDVFFYRLKFAKQKDMVYKRKYLVKDLFNDNGYKMNESNCIEMTKSYKIDLFEKGTYSNTKNIFIATEEVKIYPLIELLEKKYITEDKMAYNIKSILISRPKVIKKFNQFVKSLNGVFDNHTLLIGFIYSIIDGSILTESEIAFIANHIVKELKADYSSEFGDIKEEELSQMLFGDGVVYGGVR